MGFPLVYLVGPCVVRVSQIATLNSPDLSGFRRFGDALIICFSMDGLPVIKQVLI
jgi:hypothetical protein